MSKKRQEKLGANLEVFKLVKVGPPPTPISLQRLEVYNKGRTIHSAAHLGVGAIGDLFDSPSQEFTYVLGKVLVGERFYAHQKILPQDWPEW